MTTRTKTGTVELTLFLSESQRHQSEITEDALTGLLNLLNSSADEWVSQRPQIKVTKESAIRLTITEHRAKGRND